MQWTGNHVPRQSTDTGASVHLFLFRSSESCCYKLTIASDSKQYPPPLPIFFHRTTGMDRLVDHFLSSNLRWKGSRDIVCEHCLSPIPTAPLPHSRPRLKGNLTGTSMMVASPLHPCQCCLHFPSLGPASYIHISLFLIGLTYWSIDVNIIHGTVAYVMLTWTTQCQVTWSKSTF